MYTMFPFLYIIFDIRLTGSIHHFCFIGFIFQVSICNSYNDMVSKHVIFKNFFFKKEKKYYDYYKSTLSSAVKL